MHRCIVCHATAEHRDCCPDRPLLCDQHHAEHMRAVHRLTQHHEAAPAGSIDDYLAEAVVAELDEDDS